MRLKIQKGKKRRLADHQRKYYSKVARRDKAVRDGLKVMEKAIKEVQRQVRVHVSRRRVVTPPQND